MAEDCVNHAITLGTLDDKPCVTRNLHLHGYHEHPEDLGPLWVYGADAEKIRALAGGDAKLLERMHPDLTYCPAEVIWAVRNEMARTVEDVLARRTRALFLNAQAAIDLSRTVARIMASELGYDAAWVSTQIAEFGALARNYQVPKTS
jgi:glycerol-3-phosphate dehydrogenase